MASYLNRTYRHRKKKVHEVKAIIDLGATRNFILLTIIFTFRINIRVKTAPYELLVLNREAINSNKGIVDIKTKELIIEMPRGHLERIMLDIVPIG